MKLKVLGLLFIVPMICLLLVAFYNIGLKNSLICTGIFVIVTLAHMGLKILTDKDL